MMKTLALAGALVALALATSAVADPLSVPATGTQVAQMKPMPGMSDDMHGGVPGARAKARAQSPSTKALMAADAKMHRDMMRTMTGDADVDFVSGMIPHHQGAIDMAKVELAYGKDPELRKLAETIIAAQEKEIADMQAWLKAHGR